MSELAPDTATGHPDRAVTVGDIVAAILLGMALLLPWNAYFGVGVPESLNWLFAPLLVATLLSWGSLAADHLGRRGTRASRPAPPPLSARMRLALNLPYLVVAAGFLVFAIYQVIRYGGTGYVPAGIGPGALTGVGGAVLAAQPRPGERGTGRWFGVSRVTAVVAMVLATLAVCANLYWRTRFVWPALGDPVNGGKNTVVLATTLVYALVALLIVVWALRWLRGTEQSARLATVALGIATVLGAASVWILPVGRDIDAFRGIAQTTSTAGVGFEGYLAWVIGAAIVGRHTLRQALTRPLPKPDWRGAARKCLALIAICCVCAATLRVFDLLVAGTLGLPNTPYDSVALLAFDVVTAAIALWLRANVATPALHPAVISALSGVLVVLTVCRVAVGVGLAPRIMYSAAPEGLDSAVFGNMLAQQITSTFDVVVCWLALVLLAAAVAVLQRGDRSSRGAVPVPAAPPRAVPPPPAPAGMPVGPLGGVRPAATVPQHPAASPQGPVIASPPSAQPTAKQVASDALAQSTQRFAAGTTYTGSGRRASSNPDQSPR